MFTTNDILAFSSFMKRIKEKDQFVFFEYHKVFARHRLIVEFNVDEYDMMSKFVKDWILFHSSLVDSYYIETNNDLVDFIINLKERV